MTVAAQSSSQQFVAAAGQLVFPFSWRTDSSDLVTVWVDDVQDGGFTVALNVDQTAAPGGVVTLATPMLGGEAVTVERVTPLSQNTVLNRYSPFAADTIAATFDKMVMLIQELSAKVGRAFLFKRSDKTFATPGGELTFAVGEALVDSGDGAHFTSAFAPTSAAALYRNGQRIFSPDDYTVVGNVWTLTAATDPLLGETLNADYIHA